MRLTDFGSFSFGNTGFYAGDFDDPDDLESSLIAIPGADGAFDAFGQAQSPRRPRVVKARFGIEPILAGLTVDEQLDTLLKVLHTGQQWLKVKMTDGSSRQALAKCIKLPRPRVHGSLHFLDLSAEFELQDPYWYAIAQTVETFAGVGASPYNFNTSNIPGTAPVKKLQVTIKNAITNPRLTNNTNGFWCQWTGALGGGDVLIFDTAAMTVTKNAADVYGAVTLGATQIGFMRLEPGVNAMTLTGTGLSAVEVDLTYRPTYF